MRTRSWLIQIQPMPVMRANRPQVISDDDRRDVATIPGLSRAPAARVLTKSGAESAPTR